MSNVMCQLPARISGPWRFAHSGTSTPFLQLEPPGIQALVSPTTALCCAPAEPPFIRGSGMNGFRPLTAGRTGDVGEATGHYVELRG